MKSSKETYYYYSSIWAGKTSLVKALVNDNPNIKVSISLQQESQDWRNRWKRLFFLR